MTSEPSQKTGMKFAAIGIIHFPFAKPDNRSILPAGSENVQGSNPMTAFNRNSNRSLHIQGNQRS